MILPAEIAVAVGEALGSRVAEAAPVSGGDVNRAARVTLADGRTVFVKWRADAAPGVFTSEADGLRQLGAANALRVPDVLAVGDGAGDDTPRLLVLEWVAPMTPHDPNAFSRRFAVGLAALHRVMPPDGAYGLDVDNWLGSQPQPNTPPTADWATFYRDKRLAPQIERARRKGLLTPDRERLLDGVLSRLPTLLDGMPPGASLIHGDLWSGNFLCAAGGEPVLIDPAVHYAPREMELAYVELFGGFPPAFVRHYDAAFPLDGGYPYRRALHQLYPLLIHLNHFGESYGPAVERACAAYG